MNLTLTPIGLVETEETRLPRHWSVSDVRGRLVFQERYAAGLRDIEKGQLIVVLFHFHASPVFTSELMLQTPPTRSEPRGVFSTCSPVRPNPIGLSVLEVEQNSGTTLHVRGLDMLDGTPILDVKPHKTRAAAQRDLAT